MRATPLDILAEELGAVAGRIEREATLRIEAAIADLRRIDAERELRLSNLERAVADRLALVKDGDSVTVDDVAPLIAGEVSKAVAALPVPKDGAPGASVTVDDVRPLIAGEVSKAIAALPVPKDGAPGASVTVDDVRPLLQEMVDAIPRAENGKSVTLDDVRPLVAEAVAALPKPTNGKDGKMSPVRDYSDRVHYEGEIVAANGSTYQASCDTGRAPPHSDWICLAAAGRDGRSFRVRDTFDPAVNDYQMLDVVALGGAAFVARRDVPGVCPGEGWQLISMQGKRGNPGEKGSKGERGPAGPAIESMSIDDEGLLKIANVDGVMVECDLYPLLSKLNR